MIAFTLNRGQTRIIYRTACDEDCHYAQYGNRRANHRITIFHALKDVTAAYHGLRGGPAG